MIWTVFPYSIACGYCARIIRADQPVGLRTAKQLVRCAACLAAEGIPVDEAEVDLERTRLLLERERAAMQQPTERPAPAPVHRHKLSKPLKPASAVPPLFDAKSLAAGGRE